MIQKEYVWGDYWWMEVEDIEYEPEPEPKYETEMEKSIAWVEHQIKINGSALITDAELVTEVQKLGYDILSSTNTCGNPIWWAQKKWRV